jgi:hypothetical protein
MSHANNLLNRLSNIFTKDPNSLLGQLLGAIGARLDAVDPAQNNFGDASAPTTLEQSFAMTTATGADLDRHGKDWNVPRRAGESDKDYRARIQALLPVYTNGPTVAAISSIVKNFTGVAPIILEYGPQSFTMGVTPMGNFVFTDGSQPFTFQVQVQGTNVYKKADLETAVNTAKPARATALFSHGTGGI